MARFKPVEAEELTQFLAVLYDAGRRADEIGERLLKTIDRAPGVTTNHMRELGSAMRGFAKLRDNVTTILIHQMERAELEQKFKTAAHGGKLAAGLSGGDAATGE